MKRTFDEIQYSVNKQNVNEFRIYDENSFGNTPHTFTHFLPTHSIRLMFP